VAPLECSLGTRPKYAINCGALAKRFRSPISATTVVAVRAVRFLPQAIRLVAIPQPRANTAVAHKLARMVYFMLTRGEAFVDQGQQRYEEQQRQRSIAALRRSASVPRTPAPAKRADSLKTDLFCWVS
jgi:hypothetical protein